MLRRDGDAGVGGRPSKRMTEERSRPDNERARAMDRGELR